MGAYDRMTKEDREYIAKALGRKPKKPKSGLWKLVYGKEEIVKGRYSLCVHIRKQKEKEPQYKRLKLEIIQE